MPTNPNWPNVKVNCDFSLGPPNNVPGVNVVNINAGNVSVTDLTTKRGHQYELDAFQAGTATITVSDPSENLNPSNGSSPWNSGANLLKPYRLVQVTATWLGVTYNIFTGYIERYPQTWDVGGFRGIKPLTAVDALSVASRTVLNQTYAQEIAADSPVVTIPLDDAASPGMINGISTRAMSTFTIAGGAIQWGGDTMPDGTKAVSLSQQLQQSPISLITQYAEVDSRQPAYPSEFSLYLGGCTVEWWSKIIKGCGTFGAFMSITDGQFNRPDISTTTNFWVGLFPFGGGAHFIGLQEPIGTGYYNLGAKIYADSAWHHFAVTFKPNVGTPTRYDCEAYVDGASQGLATNLGPIRHIGINSVHTGVGTEFGDYQSIGAVGRIAAYPSILSAARVLAHFQRGAGYFGESVPTRSTRLLNQYWSSSGTQRIIRQDSSYPTALAGDFSYDGRNLLDVLQEMTTTDAGRVYADVNGAIVVEAKNSRDVRNSVSLGTFGEFENPYIEILYDYDPTYVYSQSTLSRPNGTLPIITTNVTAQADYGQRILSATLQSISDFRLIQAGIYFKFAYSNARLRIQKIRLDPSANPSLWPLVLGLEISQRFTVKRRTAGGVTLTADHYVESISHNLKADGPSWVTEIELSPVLVNKAGIVGDTTFGLVGTTAILAY